MIARLTSSLSYKVALLLFFTVTSASMTIFFYGLSVNRGALESKATEIRSADVVAKGRFAGLRCSHSLSPWFSGRSEGSSGFRFLSSFSLLLCRLPSGSSLARSLCQGQSGGGKR